MHDAVQKFIKGVRAKFPDKFRGKEILEFGSMNINGSPREFFTDCEYIGVDWRKGKDVDIICSTHEFKTNKQYDVIVSTEMLEHDVDFKKSIWTMLGLLKKDGLIIITCAGRDRKSHELECGKKRYYENLKKDDLVNDVYMSQLKEFYFRDKGLDLQFWGIRE